MNKIAKLTPFLSVAAQLSEDEFGTLAARGFNAVVNNRPDGESAGQPPNAALAAAAAAERHGLAYRHFSVVSGQVSDDSVANFAPCRTSRRPTTPRRRATSPRRGRT